MAIVELMVPAFTAFAYSVATARSRHPNRIVAPGRAGSRVNATSTQGAVKAEDKAKQAVGGVQLVRLSFPPELDTAAAARVLHDAVAAIYSAQ